MTIFRASLFLTVLCLGCNTDPMAPLPTAFFVFYPDQVPVILVGQVLENSHAVGLPRRSEWDGRLFQLYLVRVRVEQVLQGDVAAKEVEIFYFPDMDGGESSAARVLGNLYAGHSEMFFLEWDFGKLRTICDGWSTCIKWVRTGTHYHFKTEPGQSIEERMVRLFLSRGDHTTDAQMIDAIYHPELRWGNRPVFEAFQRLAANDPSPAVRAVTHERLRDFDRHYGSVEEPQRE